MAVNVNFGNTTGWANTLFQSRQDERAEEESNMRQIQGYGNIISTGMQNYQARQKKNNLEAASKADAEFRLNLGQGSDGPEIQPIQTARQAEEQIQYKFDPPEIEPATSSPVRSGVAEAVPLPTQQAMERGAQPAPVANQPPMTPQEAMPVAAAPQPGAMVPANVTSDPVQSAPPPAVQQQIAAETQARAEVAAQQEAAPQQAQQAQAQAPQAMQQAVQAQAPQQAVPQQAPQGPAPMQQAAPQQAPQGQQASPQPQSAPPTAAVPTRAQITAAALDAGRQALQAPRLPTGELNTISPDVFKARISNLENLARQGKIDPQTAVAYTDMLRSAQSKQYESALDLQEKIGKITGQDLTNREKAVKIGVETRKAQDNMYDDVYQLFKNGDTQAAKILADEYRIQFDPMDREQIKVLEARGNRSEQAKDRRKETREEDKGEREDRKIDVAEARISSNEQIQRERMDASERRFMQAQAGAESRLDRRLAASGSGGAAGTKENNRITKLDVDTQNSMQDVDSQIKNIRGLIDNGTIDSASGIENVTGWNKLPFTKSREAKGQVDNAFQGAVLSMKQALSSGGVGMRGFDSNAEAKALEKAVANIDYSAGDTAVRKAFEGVITRFEQSKEKLNRAREAEGLPPIGSQPARSSGSGSGGIPSGWSVKQVK